MVLSGFKSTVYFLFISVFLSSCATQKPISEITADTQKIIFVQHGHYAQFYKLGMHDAASFWSNDSGILGAVASMVNIGEVSKATQTIKDLMSQSNLVGKTSAAVHRAMQKKFQKRFHNKKPIVVKNQSLKYNENGDLFTGKSNADIAVIFSINRIELTAPPSMGNFFGDIATLGLQDKDIAPMIYADIKAYKKDNQKKHAELVWAVNCSISGFNLPNIYTLEEMQNDKSKSRQLFNDATQQLIEECVENIMDS